MLKRLNVQNKILATLAVPILVILVAATVFAGQSISAWREAQQTKNVVDLVDSGQTFIEIIQNERYWAIEYRRGAAGADEEWQKAIALRNQALDEVGSALEDINTSRLSPEVQRAIDLALKNTRAFLEAAEGQASRGAATTQVVSKAYTDAIDNILRVASQLGSTADDRRVGNAALAYVTTTNYLDDTISEIPLISEALTVSRSNDGVNRVYRELATTVRLTNASRDDTRNTLNRLVDVDFPSLKISSAQYTAIRQYLANGNISAISGPLAEQWGELAQVEVEAVDPIVRAMMTEMKDAANDQLNNARTNSILTIIVVIVVFAASLAIAYVTSRSITRPLRRLTESAERVKEELPRLVEQVAIPGQGPDLDLEEIDIDSRDEVGQLAAAFNSVNHTTVEVAREQAALRGSIAEMFVNVARRDHVLLNRQLGFLDELERAEEDPNILANLFRLDHLATRMRRNSESLLVLAGIDSGRRVRQPMPMSDVVRTASSEIELYDRIQLNLQSDPAMLGHNALNAAHLIAELLENATNFSEPNTPVEVTTDAGRNFVTVIIRDYGLGMSDDDISEANRKVASRSATDVIGVQRVGLFVVGRLADRLGVHVAFSRPNDGSTGTVATLSFPWNLFTDAAYQDYQGRAPQAGSQTYQQPQAPQPSSQFAQPQQPAQQANQFGQPQQPQQQQPMQQPAGYPVEEPPVVSEVDLNALTDGQTNTGMPRRRVSNAPTGQNQAFAPQQDFSGAPLGGGRPAASAPQAPAQQAPAQGLPSRGGAQQQFAPQQSAGSALPSRGSNGNQGVGISPDFGDDSPEIVLPPLATPTRTVSFDDDSAPWQPEVIQEARPLVTRRPAVKEHVEEAPLGPDASLAAQPERRSAMFSNFRSFSAPQEGTEAQAPSAGSPFAQPADDDDSTQVIDRVTDSPRAEEVAEPWRGQQDASTHADHGQHGASEAPQSRADLAKFAHLPTRASRARAQSDTAHSAPQAASHSVAADAALPQEPRGYQPNPDMVIPGLVDEARDPGPQGGFPQQTPAQYYRSAASAFSAQSAHEAHEPDEDRSYGTPLPPQRPESVYEATQEPLDEQHNYGQPASTPSWQNNVAQEQPMRPQFAPIFGDGANEPSAPAAPNFADVVSDLPQEDTKSKKNGLRGWLRKGKSTDTSAHETVAEPTAPQGSYGQPQFGQFSGGQQFQPAQSQGQQPFRQPTAPSAAEPYVPQVPQRVSSYGAGSAPHAASAPYAASAPAAPAAYSGGTSQSWEPTYAPSAQEPAAREFPQGGSSVTQWQPPTDLTVDVNSAFALKSTIQEQALAELSQLSAYRPSEVDTNAAGSLTRRVRSTAAPQALTDDPTTQKISRDAAELRARLSAFQSATSRGRRDGASEGPPQNEHGNDRNGQSQLRVPDSATRY